MLAIAEQLVACNYNVSFVSGSGYGPQVEAVGASFVSVEGYGDFYDLTSWDLDPACMSRSLLGPRIYSQTGVG
jgi:UDP:flavonoid glycosyltransferase YjiC (YdhE family)